MRLVEHLEQEKKWSAGAVLTLLSLDPLDFQIFTGDMDGDMDGDMAHMTHMVQQSRGSGFLESLAFQRPAWRRSQAELS